MSVLGCLAGGGSRLELAPTDGSGWCIRCCGHGCSCSDVNIPPEGIINILIRPYPQLSSLVLFHESHDNLLIKEKSC